MAAHLLDDVVISAGRFEQKVSDLTVSMDVLKAEAILRRDPSDITATLKTVPGVDINDKQPSIRGGSGWTYGVGARSLILVDGMSVLTPGSGEINWNTIPMENIAQVEILKGASSVLYGSSALNGVIHIRTARPGLVPQTHVNAYLGIYDDPDNSNYSMLNSMNDVIKMIINQNSPGIGAQFYNVSKARIYGTEIATTGVYTFNPNALLAYNLGYVFIQPEDAGYKEKNAREAKYTDPLQMKEKSNTSRYLKYRQKHTFKASFDFE